MPGFWKDRLATTLVALIALLVIAGRGQAADDAVEFNRDIRPILADRCFACHGPDSATRETELRLDLKDSAFASLDGHRAIVPGEPEKSELFRRITSADTDERMPPTDSHPPLTDTQIRLIETWIRQGAPWQQHWAWYPPKRPELPDVANHSWPRHPIDHFVLARLKGTGLAPSPADSREALIRRVTFDLTGLPPTLEEIDAFLNDDSPSAYEAVVDRLLASDRYGEHMATPWLDAARYADTNGYNNDTPRYNWRWRDWVIEAFNRNLPYDRFITEQLAGDLLPTATLEQKIATGFNRNHGVTSEGGIIDEEYRLEYVADRVHTTATVFLALSMRCARCHDHKFDTFTQRDYYRFFALFNQVPEQGYHKEHVGNVKPVIAAPTRRQQQALASFRKERERVEASIRQREATADDQRSEWESQLAAEILPADPLPEGQILYVSFDGDLAANKIRGSTQFAQGRFGPAFQFDGKTHIDLGDAVAFERHDSFSLSAWVRPTAGKAMNILSRMDAQAKHRGWDLTYENGPVSIHLIHASPGNQIKVQTKRPIARDQWTHVLATYDGSSRAAGVRIYFGGVRQDVDVQHDDLSKTITTTASLRIGRRTDTIPFVGRIDEVRIFRQTLSDEAASILAKRDPLPDILAVDPELRTTEQTSVLRARYLADTDPAYPRLQSRLLDIERETAALKKSIPTAMVMEDMAARRDTFVLQRGAYDRPGDKVSAGVLGVLPPLAEDAPRNRLGLAQWLTQPDQPLTARVMVNRIWQQLFGTGLVETVEDFGSQGAWPSHPQLLDWLATDFREGGWDIKQLVRQIVTSATYRQASRVTPRQLELDPHNRLLARGPRFRMTAEMIRDNALALSGLIVHRLGGPSVKPYQPPGLWTEVSVADDSYSGGPFRQDVGDNLYRRSVYTYWKRTCPPPTLGTFDAPDREFCTMRRSRTNTPLQALALMNDPTYVESARTLAERIMYSEGTTPPERVAFGFRLTTAREPSTQETDRLTTSYHRALQRFQAAPAGAAGLLAVGDSAADATLDASELAAWTTVASILLNLDEVITKH